MDEPALAVGGLKPALFAHFSLHVEDKRLDLLILLPDAFQSVLVTSLKGYVQVKDIIIQQFRLVLVHIYRNLLLKPEWTCAVLGTLFTTQIQHGHGITITQQRITITGNNNNRE